MRMADLLNDLPIESALKEVIIDFIRIKSEHSEKYTIERSEFVESFIKNIIAELQSSLPKNPPKADIDEYDDVFRKVLLKSGT